MADELSMVIENPHEGKFLKHIDWNREEFMELVASITKEYEGLTYTEDQMKAAKADRARLNAMKKAVSDRRIEVKNAVMAPYTQFEKEVKEITALIEKPISMIDSQIKEYEERTKREKREKLEEHFRETAGELDGILTFDMVFDPKYLNASVSLKKAKEEMEAAVEQFRMDLRTIDTVCEEKYQTAAKNCYIKTLNISKALEEAAKLKSLDQKMEEERKRKAQEEEERKRQEEEHRKAAEEKAEAAGGPSVPVAEHTAAVSEQTYTEPGQTYTVSEHAKTGIQKTDENTAPSAGNASVSASSAAEEDTRQYKSSFTIYGTKAQIMAVKQYMLDHNIRFGKVEK